MIETHPSVSTRGQILNELKGEKKDKHNLFSHFHLVMARAEGIEGRRDRVPCARARSNQSAGNHMNHEPDEFEKE